MRRLPLLAAAVLLAGCSDEPAPVAPAAPEAQEWWTPPMVVVADGAYTWHEYDTSAFGLFQTVYNPTTQTVANPCSWEGGAYFSNRPIPTGAGQQPVRNGTLRIAFDWTDADYPFPTLVAGYRAPGMDAVADSPRIPRGQAIEVRVEPGRQPDSGHWVLFACLNRSDDVPGDGAWQPGPFLGAFTVHAEFQPDPEPRTPPEPGARRTSRG